MKLRGALLTALCLLSRTGATAELHALRSAEDSDYRWTRISLESAMPGTAIRVGWVHDYRAFSLPDAALGNGHVHRSGPSLRGQRGGLLWTLTPRLAVSSNVLRERQDFRADDLQPAAELLLQQGRLTGGVALTDALGRFQPLPVLFWEPDAGPLQLRIGFPELRAGVPLGDTLRWENTLQPKGGRWQVRDADFTERAFLRQERWEFTTALAYAPHPRWTLQLGLSLPLRERWHLPQPDGPDLTRNPRLSPLPWLALHAGW